MRSKSVLAVAACAALAVFAQVSSAASVTFVGASGSLAAKAVFDLSGTTLKITLSNEATVQASAPADLLTAVFWGTGSTTSFNGSNFQSVAIAPGSTLVGTGTATDAGVFGFGSAQGDATRYAVSSAGLNINYFGIRSLNSASPPSGDSSPNGPRGGLVPTVGFVSNPPDPGGINTSNQPLIQNALVYKIKDVTNFSLADIRNVVFQYGTALNEPSFPPGPGPGPLPVPTPASVWTGSLLLGVAGLIRRRRGTT